MKLRMSKREINLYIDDILESIGRIEDYVRNLSENDFLNDMKTIDAVVRNLSVMGEAVNNIPDEIKIKHPDIPWDEIIGMRNKIIHEYFGVDADILWETVKTDLPAFREQILKLSKEIL
jgi:uncharacterized protein with HEPN domain